MLLDIQTKQTISYGIRRGNLYYLDMTSTNIGKLSPTLVADNLWKKRNQKFGYGINV